MRIIKLTVDLALEDFQDAPQLHDAIADQIVDLCMEKFEVEVCDVRLESSRVLNVPDFNTIEDFEANDPQIEDWQAKARADFARYRQIAH